MALNDTITALGNAIINLVDKKTPIATANTVGMVKPDGSTINIDANGVISSNGGGGYHPNIFECKWSDHIINDIQWLRADTFSWQSGDVYTTAYNKLVEEYNTGIEETEGDITYKRSTNGYKICTSDYESSVVNKYNNNGVAWYYILDTTSKKFKLPRTKFGFEGLRNNVGNDIAESLPNLKSNSNDIMVKSDATGLIQYNANWSGTNGTSYTFYVGDFDASRSSSTYQDNAPVQERATQMYLYFYVGEYTREAIAQTAGITSEQLNSKVDISSLSEINPMIESYVNGTSGYNIWANGYCEQWGVFTSTQTITYLKTFKNTNYSLLTTPNSPTSYSNPIPLSQNGWTSKTVSGFSGYADVNLTREWKACGYLAEGEY